MITVEGEIVALLTANAGVTALVGNRIHPFTVPQSLPRPKLTFQRLMTTRDAESGGFSNDGPTGFASTRIQIDAWADTPLVAKQITAAVRRCLNGYSGNGINCIQVIDERELPATLYEGQGSPIQRQMIEVRVIYTDT